MRQDECQTCRSAYTVVVLRYILLITSVILRVILLISIKRPSSCCRPYCTCEVHLMLVCRLSFVLDRGTTTNSMHASVAQEDAHTPMVLYIDRWLFDRIHQSNCMFGSACAWIACWCDVVWLRCGCCNDLPPPALRAQAMREHGIVT